MRSKAIRCLKTGKFRCPVPGCSIAGCSRVGVAKHFRRHHRDYRSWRDVFLNKDAPHFVLKNDPIVSPTASGKKDKIESDIVKNKSNKNEGISIKGNIDKSSNESELVTFYEEALPDSDNDNHQEKSPLKITPFTTEESWSKNHQVPICSISADSHNTPLSNAQVLSPSINVPQCPVAVIPCMETGESILSKQQHSRNIADGQLIINQALQPQNTIISSTENQIPFQSINATQPNTMSNGTFVVMTPLQVYPQNTLMNHSYNIQPQSLHIPVQNHTNVTPPKQKLTLDANTSAYPLSNPYMVNRGNDASPQMLGNATFSQPPILLAMPVMACNPGIFQTESPMNAQFSKNPTPFLTHGGVAYIPSTMKPDLSSLNIASNTNKLNEEAPPSHNFISYPQPSILPFGQNLQLIQSVPTHQPTTVNLPIAKLVSQ